MEGSNLAYMFSKERLALSSRDPMDERHHKITVRAAYVVCHRDLHFLSTAYDAVFIELVNLHFIHNRLQRAFISSDGPTC